MTPKMSFRNALGAALLGLLACAVPGARAADPVTLTQNGPVVTLANGIVTATVNTASAGVTSLRYAGHEMVSNRGRHTRVYFSMSGGTGTSSPRTAFTP